MTNDTPPQVDGFVKNAKAVMNLLVVTGLSWLALTVQQSTTQIAILGTKVDSLTSQITQATSDRYTSHDADKDLRSLDARITHNASEMDSINSRLTRLETLMPDKRR